MALFQKSVLNKYLKQQDDVAVKKAYKKFVKYFFNPITQQNIRDINEEGFQQKFLMELFVTCFGYVINPDPDYNLTTEFKNLKDAKKADGAILVEGKAIGVIELKGTNTKNLEKCRQQAFDYKSNHPTCIYVITSNFEKLRFYINTSDEFEEFNLFTLTETQFALLYLCVFKENLLSNTPLKIKEASIQEEEAITKKFYNDYTTFKRELFRDLIKLNMTNEVFRAELNIEDSERANKNIKQNLFKKSQKLIDRFLFVFFGEDRGLLPPNSTLAILKKWQDDVSFGDVRPLYNIFKIYFNVLDKGRVGVNGKAEIFAYNGGLFKPDPILENLIISDELLYKHTKNLSNYDFDSQLDVNILGHIFENSLNEIENVNAEIEGGEFDKQTSKRKKDGVFYTPKYITKYIVDNTVGKLCNEKKEALGITDERFLEAKKRSRQSIKDLDEYREWLLQLTILDPACGSGAFLNQALDFLIKEHSYLDELQAKYHGGFTFPDIENTVLENNIFGVDINEESVEIAKLSLWLRTAQPRRKLNNLSNNIKCGNSLIDDPEVAGDLAFNWQEQFPTVFEKGGFDVVIGNPPYVRQELISEFKPFFKKTFKTYSSSADLYTYFIEMGVDRLISDKGVYSIIVGNKWMRARFATDLRKWMKEKHILEMIDFGDLPVFENVSAYPVILTLKRNSSEDTNTFVGCEIKDLQFDDLKLLVQNTQFTVDRNLLVDEGWSLIDQDAAHLIANLKSKGQSISDFIGKEIYRGLLTGLNEAFIIDKETRDRFVSANQNNQNIIKPLLAGRDIKRYHFNFQEQYLILLPSGFTNTHRGKLSGEQFVSQAYPEVYEHLQQFEDKAIVRSDQGEFWWELRPCDFYDAFEKPKIIYPNICIEPQFCLESDSYYTNQKCFIIPDRGIEILGVLNSSLYFFLFKQILPKLRGGYFEPSYTYLKDFPLLEFTEQHQLDAVKAQIQKHQEFIELKNGFAMLLKSEFSLDKLNKNLVDWPRLEVHDFLKELKKAKVKLDLDQKTEWLTYFNKKKTEANALQSEISHIDKQIDQMVYELYGLSEEEIKIVEEG